MRNNTITITGWIEGGICIATYAWRRISEHILSSIPKLRCLVVAAGIKLAETLVQEQCLFGVSLGALFLSPAGTLAFAKLAQTNTGGRAREIFGIRHPTPKAWDYFFGKGAACWVLGDVHHGFPHLSGVGRLIIKDAIMLDAAVTTLADSAKAHVKRRA